MKKLLSTLLCLNLSLQILNPMTLYADEKISDTIFHNSWGCESLKVDDYIDYAYKNSNDNEVIVAVLDGGVDYTHEFLEDRIAYNKDGSINGYDFVDDDDDPMDDHYENEIYHGTHVAGIIADCTQTLNIKIMPVRCGNKDGYFDSEDVANGIYYAVDHGADVINCSFYVDYGDFSMVDEAVAYAISNNVTIVAAAGNDYASLDDELADRCPQHISDVICVSNVTYYDDQYELSETSNYGKLIDFTAPGTYIYSCKGGESDDYQYLSGTSMASPHISACAAMLLLMNPDLTPSEIQAQLKASCLDLGEEGKDIYYGNGLPQMDYFVVNETNTKQGSHLGIIAGGVVLVVGAAAVVIYLKKRK